MLGFFGEFAPCEKGMRTALERHNLLNLFRNLTKHCNIACHCAYVGVSIDSPHSKRRLLSGVPGTLARSWTVTLRAFAHSTKIIVPASAALQSSVSATELTVAKVLRFLGSIFQVPLQYDMTRSGRAS